MRNVHLYFFISVLSLFSFKTVGQEFEPPELEFAFELRVTIDTPIELGEAPLGKRIMIPISGGTFKGPKLKGTILKKGADYQYITNNGELVHLDAIYAIKTDDGVFINVRNTGIIYNPKQENSAPYFRAAPKFEAPINSKYAWLNNAIFICKPEGKKEYISIQVWKVL
ncbi:DUF3237 domain-containing protein [Zunongwangia sp. HRR-M8]|uniref:DUF3237 domain-containing protein n=1 Tax=Zunongwangia sp. HRR-M8 TaxID=3015170 RepID=UPI0022DD23AD|nr:DUF3237 domain-containing protein [Zunongwangia sp. HRR-M8]WBL22757.1 DUF3237 domain-containing protein [Zunongwangia sp. HRR-M8]